MVKVTFKGGSKKWKPKLKKAQFLAFIVLQLLLQGKIVLVLMIKSIVMFAIMKDFFVATIAETLLMVTCRSRYMAVGVTLSNGVTIAIPITLVSANIVIKYFPLTQVTKPEMVTFVRIVVTHITQIVRTVATLFCRTLATITKTRRRAFVPVAPEHGSQSMYTTTPIGLTHFFIMAGPSLALSV